MTIQNTHIRRMREERKGKKNCIAIGNNRTRYIAFIQSTCACIVPSYCWWFLAVLWQCGTPRLLHCFSQSLVAVSTKCCFPFLYDYSNLTYNILKWHICQRFHRFLLSLAQITIVSKMNSNVDEGFMRQPVDWTATSCCLNICAKK